MGTDRSRLTYANIVATLALLLALGGVSYAAVTLPANSVGTRQVKDGSLRPRDLAPATLPMRAAGLIAADGTLSRAHGIAAVTKVNSQLGTYCIAFDAKLAVSRSTLVVPIPNTASTTATHIQMLWEPTPSLCRAKELTVTTLANDVQPGNLSFYLLVP